MNDPEMETRATNLDFAAALRRAVHGGTVITRNRWQRERDAKAAFNGPWVCYMTSSTIPEDMVNTRTRQFIPTGPLNLAGYFVFFDGFRWQCGWTPTTDDLTALDWAVVTPE